jgi:hypothetical protein
MQPEISLICLFRGKNIYRAFGLGQAKERCLLPVAKYCAKTLSFLVQALQSLSIANAQ